MDAPPITSPSLTVALALAVGVLAQSIARHLRIPGIVLLLAAGVLLGPDGAGLIRPALLGESLSAIVGFAVAVILFEGGMNLDLRRLRREARGIRQLVTAGALVTAVGGTLAARFLMGWSWNLAVLFGTLVIVTGPTVVTPLLRRLRVTPRVSTVLEAEGVLGDPIGALLAVMALEVVLGLAEQSSGLSLAWGAWGLISRLAFGIATGLAGGVMLAWLLRPRRVVPAGLENILALSLALVVYESSNAFLHESGIAAVTVAGMVVGNVRTRALHDLREFKEQLTVLLIGLLFVLLAADVRLAEVRGLGWPGVLTVLALMFVVRPLNVLAGTFRTELTPRERAFIMWLAPRGIVAAAVSSLFAAALADAGVPGGEQLQALVFLVIATTVTLQGLTGGLVAQLLGVRRPANHGYAVLGANDLARAVARALTDDGEEVVLIDANPDACQAAQAAGFRVLHGSGLNERVLLAAGLDGRAGCVALTPNDEVNLAFARTARARFEVGDVWVALRKGQLSVTRQMVEHVDGHVLFGAPRSLNQWRGRLEHGAAAVERWRWEPDDRDAAARPLELPAELELALLPLAVRHRGRIQLVDERTVVRRGDELVAALSRDRRDRAAEWLEQQGWRRVDADAESPAPAAAGS